MKVLVVSNLFPPHVLGGAEVAAHSWARWLARRGHEVRVLTSVIPGGVEGIEETEDGLAVERRDYGYAYPIGQFPRPPASQRLAWHWHDHFGREARRHGAAAIADFQPDVVNCHDLQGLGYAVLREVAASGLPCVQTLHDFGFLCVNMAMYRRGAECPRQHLVCRASAAVKRAGWSGIRRLAFWSPSRALLERYRPHLPPHLEAAAIPLPLIFADAQPASRPAGDPVRLLYVGQVTAIKGVEFILGVLSDLAGEFDFRLRIVGGGAELEKLRAQYRQAPWVEFTGRVAPEQVGDFMAASDLLLTPSLWFENAPLVISQAIHLGLPVIASRTGGLAELVAAGENGALAAPGDAAAWTAALRPVLADPTVLDRWNRGAHERRKEFALDRLGERALALFERTAAPAALVPSAA